MYVFLHLSFLSSDCCMFSRACTHTHTHTPARALASAALLSQELKMGGALTETLATGNLSLWSASYAFNTPFKIAPTSSELI